ncbi:maleylpyruvate isomerase N-terminal domain-containing protein [Rhodococcus sp. DMU1]|uniref:maleylpyruvate isomerase N-terminal domain-containing protein n=1 Tax=Rhodococcus sp. DMU1 TaxID=2722825 RepID=UPI001FF09B87|nr:maleylpyruvate isomerase N-terminal domain-containing protein [Rhodococcus sp. DMU1]
MTSTFDRDRALLIRLWRSWAERARELSDEQWTAPTRLPGWTVRDLYVHVTPDALIALLADPASDGTAKVTSAAEMLRVFNADPVAAEPMHRRIAEMVRRAATDVGRETLVERFAVELPQAFDRLTGLARETVVRHPLLGSARSSTWPSSKRPFTCSTSSTRSADRRPNRRHSNAPATCSPPSRMRGPSSRRHRAGRARGYCR